MTKREEREIALDRRVTTIDALARDAGHDLEPWSYEHGDGWSTAAVRCTECRAQAAVRIEDSREGAVEWQGGRLAWRKGPEECPFVREASAV